MATQTKSKKGWAEIGTLRKGETGSYIKLSDNVEILVDGVKIPLNEKRTVRLEDPRKKVEQLKERGYLTEAEADKRLEKLSELTWLKYTLVVPPPRGE